MRRADAASAAIQPAPPAPERYDRENEAQFRRGVMAALQSIASSAIVLRAPDGSFWKVTVDSTGVLATEAAS